MIGRATRRQHHGHAGQVEIIGRCQRTQPKIECAATAAQGADGGIVIVDVKGCAGGDADGAARAYAICGAEFKCTGIDLRRAGIAVIAGQHQGVGAGFAQAAARAATDKTADGEIDSAGRAIVDVDGGGAGEVHGAGEGAGITAL